MRLHIRTDNNELNRDARFACGIGWPLPAGDVYFFQAEEGRAACYLFMRPEAEVCLGCFPHGKPEFGTPISKLSGRPGELGYEEFCRIARSWDYN